MVYDATRARTLLFGGTSGAGLARDVWEWDGASWSRVSTVGEAPVPVSEAAVAYDASAARLVVFGGKTQQGRTNALYELDGGSGARPMAMIDVDWSTSGVASTALTDIALELGVGARGYDVDAELGADGDLVGSALDGAQVLAWDMSAGRWHLRGDNDAPAEAPAGLVSADVGFAAVMRSFDAYAREFHFAARPRYGSGNGPAAAEVVLDYASFTATYRLDPP